jgi:hypothetical protein
MKISSFFSAFFLLALTGCQQKQQEQHSLMADPNATRVILVASKQFPESMKGVWQNKDSGWILKIDENGCLTKIQHYIGRSKLIAGQTATIPLINNGQAVIEPGPWLIQYDGENRNVVIEITLKSFLYDVGGDQVKGSSRDIFIGKVPEKGESVWKAQWLSYPQYVASTSDRKYVDYILPFEEGSEDQGEIIFEKIDLDKIKDLY